MIAPQIQLLAGKIKDFKETPYLEAQENESVVEVGHVTSQVGKIYEKLRYTIDYQEEQHLRRSAIERILRRKLNSPYVQDDMAADFVTELIRAGYLPNNSLPERVIVEVDFIIGKFLTLIAAVNQQAHFDPEKKSVYVHRLLSMAATEIERYLYPPIVHEATVDAFYLTIKNYLQFDEVDLSEEERDMQIYLACLRSYLKPDENVLYFRLWLLFYPEWDKVDSLDGIDEIANDFAEVNEEILSKINHPLNWKLLPKLKDYAVFFTLLAEVIQDSHKQADVLLESPELLENEVRELVHAKYRGESYKTKRSATRAVLYIFLTKIVLALIIELPFELVILNHINYVALTTNVVFHPVLMFLITRSIHIPKKENTDRIVQKIQSIVYGHRLKSIEIKNKKKKSRLNSILVSIYFVIFIATFLGIFWFLKKLSFNIVGAGLFIFFLTLVSYMGIRIRYMAKKWKVASDRETILAVLWDVFTLPIVQAGRWMSKHFQSINIFVFILDFIIETPFKIVLDISDSFIAFLKEKKEELY